MTTFNIVQNGVRIGFFRSRLDATNALQYTTGFLEEQTNEVEDGNSKIV